MAERKLLQATDEFSTTIDGVAVNVHRGEVVDEGDPILKGRRHLFEPFEPRVRKYPGQVEQATAAPGEKRNR